MFFDSRFTMPDYMDQGINGYTGVVDMACSHSLSLGYWV